MRPSSRGPGRKTDVKDARGSPNCCNMAWISPSFIPDRPQRELRELTRCRRSLNEERSRQANRIQKLLEGANVKLSSVTTQGLLVFTRHFRESGNAGICVNHAGKLKGPWVATDVLDASGRDCWPTWPRAGCGRDRTNWNRSSGASSDSTSATC